MKLADRQTLVDLKKLWLKYYLPLKSALTIDVSTFTSITPVRMDVLWCFLLIKSAILLVMLLTVWKVSKVGLPEVDWN